MSNPRSPAWHRRGPRLQDPPPQDLRPRGPRPQDPPAAGRTQPASCRACLRQPAWLLAAAYELGSPRAFCATTIPTRPAATAPKRADSTVNTTWMVDDIAARRVSTDEVCSG